MSDNKPLNIALIIGSLRKESINRAFAEYMVSQMPEHVTVTECQIDDLPLYNEDIDTDTAPESYTRIRNQVGEADALLIVSPEYNRSIPGGLKNAMDILSRPKDGSVLNNIKVAFVTASPGTYGGRSCGFDLRKIMLPFAAQVLLAPEVYLSHATDALGEDNKVSSERTQQYLQKFVDAFVEFVED
ncbi:NADPH-dependent FMN reductase [Psychrobacter lutiphocae]|uniref:NADPH-dependent FMN reductase n=1 Tax=Psychrobacter lutiphocae TaxID=540500 RepID=UPI000365E7BF|nr:NADPH-dependent FMN reductase [Psychrobacter lutiphocae]